MSMKRKLNDVKILAAPEEDQNLLTAAVRVADVS